MGRTPTAASTPPPPPPSSGRRRRRRRRRRRQCQRQKQQQRRSVVGVVGIVGVVVVVGVGVVGVVRVRVRVRVRVSRGTKERKVHEKVFPGCVSWVRAAAASPLLAAPAAAVALVVAPGQLKSTLDRILRGRGYVVIMTDAYVAVNAVASPSSSPAAGSEWLPTSASHSA